MKLLVAFVLAVPALTELSSLILLLVIIILPDMQKKPRKEPLICKLSCASILYCCIFRVFSFVVAHLYYMACYLTQWYTLTWHSFGFGFGALERSYYDSSQEIFYEGSEIVLVTISDFGGWPSVKQAKFGIPLDFFSHRP